ncbi:hypothetical protein BGZ60DRAFT_520195 [Tricladium varicosporioides]|nr:hypothetical protein BGZ60DRAFT_520195 [Hymenoscyphus varicosporioides]
MTAPSSPLRERGTFVGDEEQRATELPNIGLEDHFVEIVRSLSIFFVDEITLPSTFEQFRTTAAGNKLRHLVDHLVITCKNQIIISALLTLKWHFSTLNIDDPRINETRAVACEIVAWRFLTQISERDAVDFCLFEIPEPSDDGSTSEESSFTEQSALLPRFRSQDANILERPSSRRSELEAAMNSISRGSSSSRKPLHHHRHSTRTDPTSAFAGLTALEIAVVADCKKFLSQAIIQKIITGIWKGDIMFWGNLDESSEKKPQFYNKLESDLFSRLRVPKYVKIFEFLFFITFLFLYYSLLMERNVYRVTVTETLLYVWFATFAYDEFSEFMGAGTMVYSVDIWNGFDSIIILIGAAFAVTRFVGLIKHDDDIIDTAFDILALEALFMVPRLCSLLSLLPFFATLIPALKAMVRDFVKFMVIVAIIYLGFLTTFTLLARDIFTFKEISWTLMRVFFGSSELGFSIMQQINPKLGPPLMVIFVIMTNTLLITSLVCALRESFSRVYSNAREEYLYVYSVYVLEASTSNSLTQFYPPFNLLPLVFIKPFQLIFPSLRLRKSKILILKISHLPIVGFIWVYEHLPGREKQSGEELFSSDLPETTRILVNSRKVDWPRKKSEPAYFPGAISKRTSSSFKIPSISPSDRLVDPGFSRESTLVIDPAKGKCAKDISMVKEREKELERKVAELSVQIAELTALIMKSQASGKGDA